MIEAAQFSLEDARGATGLWAHGGASEDDSRQDSAARPFRVLVADDQSDVREALQLLLKSDGYEIELVNGPAPLLASLQRRNFDLVILDMNYARDTTSGREGLELVSEVHGMLPSLPIMVMTAWSNVELAVEAMRRGACDFIEKPWNNRQVLANIRSHLQRGQSERRQRQKWQDEREDAIRIQRRLLPSSLPQVKGCQIAAISQPAGFVGGDYFDVVEVEGKLGLCVADVAGKGMAAALLMANLQAVLKPQMLDSREPVEICSKLNRSMSHAAMEDKFISSFHGLLQTESRRLMYCNAGHLPPILVDGAGNHERLDSGGAVLGYFGDWVYEQKQAEIRPGSKLLLFTDGITEACDSAGEEFGDERLVQLAVENRRLSAEALQRTILAAVVQFCGGRLQDDATLVVVSVD
jgi:phosphoserine phosphatase RsbU/P